MKKILLILGLFIFITNGVMVKAEEEETCEPNNTPIIENTQDFYYEMGDDIPDYLEGITSTNSCGQQVTITYNDDDVNYEKEGTYNLYYYSLGTAVTVKVYVYDSIPDFDGLGNFTINVFDEEVDFLEGITATNVYTGEDLTSEIVVDASNVDYSTVGEYEVTYTVSDGVNTAIRTVKVFVEDPTAPQIKNLQDIFLEVHTNLDEVNFWENVEVTDNSGQSVTTNIDFHNLNIKKIGSYEIEYIAIDESNNETRQFVNVIVQDTTQPTFVNLTDQEYLLNTELSESLFKQNVTLTDNYDGSLSINHIIVDYHLVDSTKPGNYPVMYIGFDSSGNQNIKIINVRIYDEDRPIVGNVIDIQVASGTDTIDYLNGVTCTDATDGDCLDQLIVNDHLVDLSKIGTYPVIYTVMDSSGNVTTKTIYITVYDENAPVINGLKEWTIEVNNELSEEYFLDGITVIDDIDGDITDRLDVDINQIDFEQLGSYTITYTVEDLTGNTTEETVSVHVVDTTPPEIRKYDDVTIVIGDKADILALLSDVIVTDNYDGDLSSDIEVKGFFDSSKVGAYPLRIVVTDTSGNETEVTFNLIVVNEHSLSNGNANLNIYYIIGGMGLALAFLGFIGYKTRRVK